MMETREPLEWHFKQLDHEMGLSFRTNFNFALVGHLLKGGWNFAFDLRMTLAKVWWMQILAAAWGCVRVKALTFNSQVNHSRAWSPHGQVTATSQALHLPREFS